MSPVAKPCSRSRFARPLVEELIPCPEPMQVARRLSHLPHLLFLDSAEQHHERGRYSYITADPQQILSTHSLNPLSRTQISNDFFSDVNQRFREFRFSPASDLPPFQGGFAGLFGYGLCRTIEHIPPNPWDEFQCPLGVIGLYDWVISFDHHQERAWLISTGVQGPEQSEDLAAKRLGHVLDLLSKPQHPLPIHTNLNGKLHPEKLSPQHPIAGFNNVSSNFSRLEYLEAVRKAIEYIRAGDCFQINLSQRLLSPLTEHPLDLYQRLRSINPAPFACYFDAGEFQVVSASPERFLRVDSDGNVSTKPIKGTRPRGATHAEDERFIQDLLTSTKDRAENVMIVDLLRNDLGRVCEYGSVSVPKVCELESFRYVHHLVSEVRGKLRSGITPVDLLRSAFPGGSVTGAPKVRAMEIIAELEPTERGAYCGSIGYLGFDGSFDTNILIRTFTAGRGWLQFPVGGGIVADSDPEKEYEETMHKALGLLRALQT